MSERIRISVVSDDLRLREFHHRLLELNGGTWFNFEPHLAAFYRAILHPGSIAVDGGANAGMHTFQMAQAILPNGMVLAIEPLPEMVAQLETRVRRYHTPENLIRLAPCGLFSTAGEADFYQVLDPIQHEMSGLRHRELAGQHEVKQIKVELTTLDTICKDLGRLDFIKLDLEGAEMDALRGGRTTLERFRPVVALEQDQHSPRYFGYTWDHLLDYFASLDYELYDLFGLRYTEAAMFEQCAVWDFVALPAEYPNRQALFAAVRRSMQATGVRFDSADGLLSSPGSSHNLTPSNLAAVCAIDYLGSVHDPLARESVRVSDAIGIQFLGWAIDAPNRCAAGGVDIVIDEVPYAAVYGRYRADVADHFESMACQNSGFLLRLPPGTLAEGQHEMTLRAISCDQRSYYPGPAVRFTVT